MPDITYSITHPCRVYICKLTNSLDAPILYLTPELHLFISIIYVSYSYQSGPGSSVGIAKGYGLDGPRIESRWGRDFPHLSRPALGPTQPPVQWVPDICRG
jgi:hypothetical protein